MFGAGGDIHIYAFAQITPAPEKYGGSRSDLSSLNNPSSNGDEDGSSNSSDSSDSSSSNDDSESYDTGSSTHIKKKAWIRILARQLNWWSK